MKSSINYINFFNAVLRPNYFKGTFYLINIGTGTADELSHYFHGLEMATKYGATDFLTTLVNISPVETFPEAVRNKMLSNAVMSDCPITFRTVLTFTEAVPEEVVKTANERGNPDIITLLSPSSQDSNEEAKIDLRNAIMHKTSSLFNLIPKSVEITYNKKIDRMKPLLRLPGTTVTYQKLLTELLVPSVHVGVKEEESMGLTKKKDEWKVCEEDCAQPEICPKIRQLYKLVKNLMKDLAEINPVFSGMKLTIIGSMREGTRVYSTDEIDLHLSLNKVIKKWTYYDDKKQCLMFKPCIATGQKTGKYNIDNIKDYMTQNNTFNNNKFSTDFFQAMYEVVSTFTLPEDFTMKPLTTDFTPCGICMKLGNGEPQAYRCRHVPDCPVHMQCQCSDKEKCILEKCSCRQFSAPSLTRSKVGAVLHVEWEDKGTTKFTLDCDLNVPTVPCGSPYDGYIGDIEEYLCNERPVNWLEELSKLEDMTEAGYSVNKIGQDDWQVKFRTINSETVLPRQVRV